MSNPFRELILAAAFLALISTTAKAVPLNNFGFETGDTTGWNVSGDVAVLACAPTVVGCAPSGATYLAALNDATSGVGNASLIQTATNVAAGSYSFGAWVSFGTNNAAANFDQGQISLTVQIPGSPGATIGFDPNGLSGEFTIPGNAGFLFTKWFLLEGTLTFAGLPADLLLNINVQDFSSNGGLVLLADNAFITATPLPAALPMFLGAAGLIGLLAGRRKQKQLA